MIGIICKSAIVAYPAMIDTLELLMRLTMSLWSWKAGVAGAMIIVATTYVLAETPSNSRMHGPMDMGSPDTQQMVPPGGMHDAMHDYMMQGQHGSNGEMAPHGMMEDEIARQPTMAGQEAFGTIQEIVQILDADPATDWSKVNIAALREHLIDMNEVALHAAAAERALDNGVEIAVTGEGRTLDAIKRMIPAHVQELGRIGWNARTEDLVNGVKLIVISTDPKQVTKLKALGFMGIMVQGAHHQRHHLLMAKGEFMH